MLTDDEVDTLAREILTKVIARICDWDGPPFEDVEETEDGELIPIYGGTSEEGYGSFRFEYMPLALVKKIILDCERIYNDFTITLSDTQSGESLVKKICEVDPPETHRDSIYTMAHSSVYYLIASFRDRLCDLMEEGARDCEMIAESLLASGVGEEVKRAAVGKITADVRADIEKAAERVAESKRTILRKAIKGLPHILSERGRGAPAKPPEDREREANAYAARVEGAYRKLRAESGRPPIKTSVATELGEGGVNPRKGSDTRLSAFGNKLRHLKVDYDAIAKKVEDELNNNS